MDLLKLKDFDDHEQILFSTNSDVGLPSVIAVHSTVAGPACGGIRMWPYNSHEEAVIDALRLSRGMTYKNIMAGLPLGGGKSVIIGNSKTDKSHNLFKNFGQNIDLLGGKYIGAEDVGINTKDVETMNQYTKHVAGLDKGGDSGDPSPITAYGIYCGIKACIGYQKGSDNLQGITVAVQGLGSVGSYLCERLANDGAKLLVADIRQDSVNNIVQKYGATEVDVNKIHSVECDVFAPCALGAIINPQTINQFNTKIIAGGANNQLLTVDLGEELRKKDILYAPDYVINAGGIIAVNSQIATGGKIELDSSLQKASKIADRLVEIFDQAKKSNKSTAIVADELAREKLAELKKINK